MPHLKKEKTERDKKKQKVIIAFRCLSMFVFSVCVHVLLRDCAHIRLGDGMETHVISHIVSFFFNKFEPNNDASK